MKKLLLLCLTVALIGLIIGSCKPPPPKTEAPKPVTPVDTTPKKVEVPKPETPVKKTIVESQFQTVYFDFDKYNLRADAKSSLDSNYNLMKTFPDVIVKIEGNCDERGTVEYNLSLGQKRAQAAMDYLTGLGITANRISTISYGKERPALQGHDESAWARNRRDEFRIISQ